MATTIATPVGVETDSRLVRGCVALLRIGVAFMWIQKAGWKVQPDFGQSGNAGMYFLMRFVVEQSLLLLFAWIMEYVVF